MLAPEKIGNRLKALRGDKTIRSVAREMGIGETALKNYEHGYRVPNDQAKEIIARYYGQTIDGLFYAE